MAEDKKESQQVQPPETVNAEASKLVQPVEPPAQRSQRRRRPSGKNIQEA